MNAHCDFVTLLEQRDFVRRQRRLAVYEETRRKLREALAQLVPGHKVLLFGSLTKPGIFNDCSDVDLALESEPAPMDTWRLRAELTERMERPVDVVLLNRCRFREKIRREAEVWIA